MKTAMLLIYIAGFHSLSFVVFHGLFWKIFKWKDELKKTSLVNRAIMQILNLRLMYIFLWIAFLCLFYTAELLNTSLGKAVLGGMSLFWLGRTIEQFVYFKPTHWVVNVLSVFFVLGAILFGLPLCLS